MILFISCCRFCIDVNVYKYNPESNKKTILKRINPENNSLYNNDFSISSRKFLIKRLIYNNAFKDVLILFYQNFYKMIIIKLINYFVALFIISLIYFCERWF